VYQLTCGDITIICETVHQPNSYEDNGLQ
jgi:hypothetical protein